MSEPTNAEIIDYAERALYVLENAEHESLMVRRAANNEMEALALAKDHPPEGWTRRISFNEARHHQGRAVLIFLAQGYGRRARATGDAEAFKRLQEKLEDLADWSNTERARTRRAGIKARSERHKTPRKPAQPPQTPAADLNARLEAELEADVAVEPEASPLRVRAVSAAVAWIAAVRAWDEGGRKGPAPQYSPEVLHELESSAVHQADAAAYLKRMQGMIAEIEELARGPEVPAPAEGKPGP